MSVAELHSKHRSPPPAPAAPAWLGTIAVGFGAGFGAVYVQSVFAPVGVFPLLVGTIIGLAVGGVWSVRGGGTKRTLVVAGLIAGVIGTATLHYGSYFVVRRDDERRRLLVPPMVLLADPSRGEENPQLRSFEAFVEREWRRGRSLGSLHVSGVWLGLWWGLDAAAVVGMAAVMAPVAAKRIEPEKPELGNDRGATS